MDFEKKLIVGCLKKDEVLKKVKQSKFDSSHFDSPLYGYIYDKVLAVSEKDKVTEETVKSLIELDEKLSDEDKVSRVKKVEDLYQEDTAGSNISLELLSKKKIEKDFLSLISDSVQRYKTGTPVEDVLRDINSRSFQLKDPDEDFQVWDFWEDYTSRKVERHEIQTGDIKSFKFINHLDAFDKYFPKGILEETITAVGGTTYTGKSVLQANMVYLAAHPENALNVLYIVAENKKIQAGSRLDAIITDKSYQRLFKDPLSDVEDDELFENAVDKGWGQIHYVKVTPNDFDVNTIRSVIEERRSKGVEFDVLAIDSPDHMKSVSSHETHWLKKGFVYYEIKQLITEESLICFTTLPMKASAAKKEYVSAEDAAGAYDIAKVADNALFFNTQPEDRLLDRARMQVVKNRDGKIDTKNIFLKFENSLRMSHIKTAIANAEEDEEKKNTKKYKIKQFGDEDE